VELQGYEINLGFLLQEQIQEIKQELLGRNSLVSSCHILFEMNSLHDTNDGEISLYFLPVLPEN
jgi:hypothetical protein